MALSDSETCFRFEVTLTSLEVYTNDERQRTFLALRVNKGRDEVFCH